MNWPSHVMKRQPELLIPSRLSWFYEREIERSREREIRDERERLGKRVKGTETGLRERERERG